MKPIFFLKFGSERYMRDLIENGTIFCRPLEGFRERAKENKPGGDLLEGVTEIKNYDEIDNAILTISPAGESGKEIKIKLTKGQFRANVSKVGNIYSLFSINETSKLEHEIYLDKKILEYGTHAVLIKDIGQFLKRIRKQAQSLNYQIHWGLMDYFDPTEKLIKDLSIFHKSAEYQYESEFRIFIANTAGESLKLTIGNIEDIAQIFEAKRFLRMKVAWH